MFTTLTARISAARNEKAESMPTVIVGVIVSSLIATLIVGMMISATTAGTNASKKMQSAEDRTHFAASLEGDMRFDFVREASATHLEFTLASGGFCRETIWDITANKNADGTLTGTQSLTRQLIAFEGNDCAGIPIPHEPVSMTVTNARFDIKTRAGRELTVLDDRGTLMADDARANPENHILITRANESTIAKQVFIQSDDFTADAMNN